MIVSTMRGAGRVMRVVCYLLLAGVGALTFWQVFGVPEISQPALWWVMSAWLCLGGLSSLAGQVARRWTGEFVGLPLVGSSLIGFSLLQLNLYGWTLAMVPSTALLWSFGLLVLSRWRDVLTLYRVAMTEALS